VPDVLIEKCKELEKDHKQKSNKDIALMVGMMAALLS